MIKWKARKKLAVDSNYWNSIVNKNLLEFSSKWSPEIMKVWRMILEIRVSTLNDRIYFQWVFDPQWAGGGGG